MTSANELALQLAQKIVEHCLSSGLEPGARLTERKLGQEIGVSRSPVRSALKLLAEHGVIARADAGFVLATDSEGLAQLQLEVPAPAEDQLLVQVLRDRFAGRLPEHVTEADLVRIYGVTRSTLMKTLMKLNQDGHISRSAGRGWTFRETLGSVESYRASYEFRLAIEPAALASPHYKVDKARVNRLLERHLRLRDNDPADINAVEWFALDAELHEMLVGFSGNEFFLSAVRGQNQLRQSVEIESFYADERVRASFDEHISILEALLKDDREWAATLLTRHLKLASESTEVFLNQADENGTNEKIRSDI